LRVSLKERPHRKIQRWALLLKQQLSTTVYRLLTKKNKLPFSVFVCSKQTDVSSFVFPFAANKWKSPFSISSILCLQALQLLFERNEKTLKALILNL
jgi:hypothetical protein